MRLPIVRRLLLLSCSGALAILGTAACMDAAAPRLPPESEQFVPPPVYTVWWEMTEACSGIQGQLSRVAFYVVPGVHRVPTGKGLEVASAYWSRSGNRIVLAGSAQFNGQVVRHEMLHALRQSAGHPREMFLQLCGGVVECTQHCVEDAGPLHGFDNNAPRVTASVLDISVTVDRERPGAATNNGFFAVTVEATNPAPHPVMVNLPRPPWGTQERWETFRMLVSGELRYTHGSTVTHDAMAGYFEASETKRHVFDVRTGADTSPWSSTLPPGTYQVSGWYGGRWVIGPSIEVVE